MFIQALTITLLSIVILFVCVKAYEVPKGRSFEGFIGYYSVAFVYYFHNELSWYFISAIFQLVSLILFFILQSNIGQGSVTIRHKPSLLFMGVVLLASLIFSMPAIALMCSNVIVLLIILRLLDPKNKFSVV